MLTTSAEAWVAFVEERNFTLTAKRLHISQPALHTKIQRFQADVGAELYRRQGSTMLITPVGESLADLIRELIQRREDFALRMAPSRPLTLAAGAGTFVYLLDRAISETLSRTDTQLSLTIKHGRPALDDVLTGRADLAISVSDSVPHGLHAQEIGRFAQVAVLRAAHPLAHARSLRLSDVAALPLVVAPRGHGARITLEQALREQRLRPEIAVETEGWELMIRFVMMGAGCAIVHSYVPQRDEIVLIPVSDMAEVVYKVVTTVEAAHDPDISRFVATVRATLTRQSGA